MAKKIHPSRGVENSSAMLSAPLPRGRAQGTKVIDDVPRSVFALELRQPDRVGWQSLSKTDQRAFVDPRLLIAVLSRWGDWIGESLPRTAA